MTTLRDHIQLMFDRAGWHHVVLDEENQVPNRYRGDAYWFPRTHGATGDVVPPVIVIWDRGEDWEPRQHIAGTWSRDTNHGDVLTSLRHAAEQPA